MNIANFGRSPGDKKEAGQLSSLWDDMIKSLREMTPWVEERRKEKIRERLKKPPQSFISSIEGDVPAEVRRALGKPD